MASEQPTTHRIQDDHKPVLARLQHVLEWLQGERARIEQEAAHVAAQGQRADAQLRMLILRGYGIEPTSDFTLEVEKGIITTPGIPASAEPAPPAEPPDPSV